MTRSLEERLSAARPRPWQDSDDVDNAASELALTIARAHITPRRRPHHRTKFSVLLAGALVLGTATTAAAVPAIVAWAPWEPDVSVQRVFTLDTGETASCTLVMKVLPDYAATTENLDRNVEVARVFLRDHDWSSIVRQGSRQADEALRLSTDAAETQIKFDEAQRKLGTGPTPALTPAASPPASTSVASDMSTDVQQVFQRAGLLKAGVSVESRIACTDEAPE